MKALLATLAIGSALLLGTGSARAVDTSTIDVNNAEFLSLKWDFPLGAGVTGSPVVANGLVYVASWNGIVYALDEDDGSVVWSFDTGSGVIIGMPGTVLLTPTGSVCFGDTTAKVWCRDALTGAPIWDKSIGTVLQDAVWSAPATANGRLFVSVASLSDQPCTNGRLIALDLATGADLWTLQTVPDMICDNDTAVECSADSDCSGGSCIMARGAGVTATVSFDSTGDSVYMNTVGCFTFPSVGDSDTIFKIDAATGAVVWKNRVDPPEQFGSCSNDSAIECGADSDCGASNTCVTKVFYHDFGFLNGPTPIEIPDGPGTKTVLITGSKNGTLYALNETDGTIAWTNAVQPKPITPGFAGFGLFNGPVTIAGGRVFAALYELIPDRVCDNDNSVGCTSDSDCGLGTCLPLPNHLMAFDTADGSAVWSDDIGPSWSGVGHANGVVYAGTNDEEGDGSSHFFAYSAETGNRLGKFPLPATTSSKATVDGDTLYIGYGIFGSTGGVRAYSPVDPVPSLSDWGLAYLAGLMLLTLVAVPIVRARRSEARRRDR